MNKLLFILIALSILINVNLSAQKEQQSGGDPFSQSKFVPDISFILDMSYLHRNFNNDDVKLFEVPGLIHSSAEEAEHGHSHPDMNSLSGFNFNYGELAVSSTVDPYFDLFGIFHLSAGGFEIEEGYFLTRGMPFGFQLKGGKFSSGIGRINEQHAHYWEFANPPLIYRALFSSEGLNEIGVQLNWIAPTDFYLVLGGEMLQGANEASFGTDGFQDPLGSFSVKSANVPNLYSNFIRSSFDVGNLTILSGISGVFGKSRINHNFDSNDPDGHAIFGDTKIININLTLKYLIESYQDITFQTEFLNRITKGDLFYKDTFLFAKQGNIKKDQSGLYAQLVYKFSKNWRMGIKYDVFMKNEVTRNGNRLDLPDMMPQLAVMVEYNPTEFSRIRLQYTHDQTKYLEDAKKISNEILLQVNLMIGAHGAHSF
jgi:hypothetical protein